MPFEDDTFDAAYAFESICYAPDVRIPFNEIRRVLKPGAMFGHTNWVMTEMFDPSIEEHRVIRDQIERGNGIARLPLISDVRSGLEQCGFVTISEEDMAGRSKPCPWYYNLLGQVRYATCMEDFFRIFMRERKIVMPLWDVFHRLMVKLRVAPKGFSDGFEVLRTCTKSTADGGAKGIFSPLVVFMSINVK